MAAERKEVKHVCKKSINTHIPVLHLLLLTYFFFFWRCVCDLKTQLIFTVATQCAEALQAGCNRTSDAWGSV